MPELLAKRKYNSKTIDNGDGSFTLQAHAGHIHYKDAQGTFRDVDYTIEDAGTFFRMAKANYRLYVNKDFDDGDVIRFDNGYDGANHSIYYKPYALAWVNAQDLSDMQLVRTAQNVTGVVDGNVIRWAEAFGSGVDFEVTLLRSGFTKEVVFTSQQQDLITPPTASHKLVALFRYRGDGLTVRKRDTAEDWDREGYFEGENGFEARETGGKASFIRKAKIEDADGRNTQLKVFWKRHNNALWQAKVIPQLALMQGTYPLRADTTTSYYAGSGDGWLQANDGTSWANVHALTTATANSGASSGLSSSYYNNVGSAFWIARMFFPIDTSGLPDNASITSASFNVYVYNWTQYDDAGTQNHCLVQTNQASTSTIASGDFDECGESLANGWSSASSTDIIEGASRVSITANGYATFALNATGLSWINKTGFTKLGVRTFLDVDNEAVVDGSKEISCLINCSEQTGTSSDPYLEVTYTTAVSITKSLKYAVLSTVAAITKSLAYFVETTPKKKAVSFDGSNDSVTTGVAMSNFLSVGTGTIFVRIKPQGTAPTESVAYDGECVIGDAGGYIGIYRAIIGGQDRLWIYNFDANEDRVGVTYTADQWVTVALVHSGGVLYAYKDGVYVGQVASGNTGDLSGSLRMGPDYTDSEYYTGDAREVKVYSRALSAQEIKDLHDSLAVSTTNLTMQWDFDEGSGTTLNDETANNYDGTLVGATWIDSELPLLTKAMRYLVSAGIGITKSLQYAVTNPVAVTKSLTYRVKTTPAALTKAMAYFVKVSDAITKSLKYAVTAGVAVTKSLKYAVTQDQAITKALAYFVKSVQSATKSLKYAVTQPETLTKAMTYAVKASQSITRQLAYAVSSVVAVTKSLKYAVQAAVSVTKSLRYAVKTTPAALTKSMKYAVSAVEVIASKGVTYLQTTNDKSTLKTKAGEKTILKSRGQ